MATPIYKFKEERFYPILEELKKNEKERKRYKLEIDLKGDRGDERWLIIMKNPSRAGEDGIEFSDCTINRVCEYFYQMKSDAKTIVVANLFPVYETNSSKLKDRKEDLIDFKNKKILIDEISKADYIVFAWGTHPAHCYEEFEEMKRFVKSLSLSKSCFQMKHPKKEVNKDRPLHGQVWGYENYELSKILFESNLPL
jgi:hypothetical protein